MSAYHPGPRLIGPPATHPGPTRGLVHPPVQPYDTDGLKTAVLAAHSTVDHQTGGTASVGVYATPDPTLTGSF